MTRDELFEIWAPRDGVWSPWAKPVLFANARVEEADADAPPEQGPGELDWVPASGDAALVLDLPAAAGVAWGLALARRGYRPVPLYNALPGPAGTVERVAVRPIARALVQAGPSLAGIPLDAGAPPAFLLDAGRRGGALAMTELEAVFDNRSVSFPTDFPSGNLLRSRGFRRVLWVQEAGREPQADLLHTLARWQDAGLGLERKALEVPGPAVPAVLRRPGWARLAVYRMLELAGLHRDVLGGFGGKLGEGAFG